MSVASASSFLALEQPAARAATVSVTSNNVAAVFNRIVPSGRLYPEPTIGLRGSLTGRNGLGPLLSEFYQCFDAAETPEGCLCPSNSLWNPDLVEGSLLAAGAASHHETSADLRLNSMQSRATKPNARRSDHAGGQLSRVEVPKFVKT